MASINGISLKNYKESDVDFSMFPNAETDFMYSGDVYLGNNFLFHFSNDINGGSLNISHYEGGKKGNYDAVLPAFYRWKTLVQDIPYVSIDDFIEELIILHKLEKNFVYNSRYAKSDGITYFVSYLISGYGIIVDRFVQGNKNLTVKIKEELESAVLKKTADTGLILLVKKPVFATRAYRKVEDFNIMEGNETEGIKLYQAEIQKKLDDYKKNTSKENLPSYLNNISDKKAKVVGNRFKITTLENEPNVLLEDSTTGKVVKVPVYAVKEVTRVLEALFINS